MIEPCDPKDYPPELLPNGRPAVPTFDDDEWLYCRFDPKLVQPTGVIDPLHIKLIPCPDLSSNRSKFSKPWHVLYPLSKYEQWAVFKFRIQDVPTTIKGDSSNAPIHNVKTEHDPEDCNYAHCETRVYKDGQRIKAGTMKPGPKDKLRLIFSRVLIMERSAGTGVPAGETPKSSGPANSN